MEIQVDSRSLVVLRLGGELKKAIWSELSLEECVFGCSLLCTVGACRCERDKLGCQIHTYLGTQTRWVAMISGTPYVGRFYGVPRTDCVIAVT